MPTENAYEDARIFVYQLEIPYLDFRMMRLGDERDHAQAEGTRVRRNHGFLVQAVDSPGQLARRSTILDTTDQIAVHQPPRRTLTLSWHLRRKD